MNRRSILTSLSSMLVAALAWPRKAEAMTGYGPGPAGPDGEQQFKRWNVPNTEFHTKFYKILNKKEAETSLADLNNMMAG